MNPVIPQVLGMLGLVIIVLSFQCKQNKIFFLFSNQAIAILQKSTIYD